MKIRSTHWLVLFFSLLMTSNQPGEAATSLTKVIMTSGSASERDGAVYVAQDQGFFRKYGLDLSFVQVRNGPRGYVCAELGRNAISLGLRFWS